MTSTDLAALWGRRIRRIRRERELTVTGVAQQVGISRRHLHYIEAGKNLPSDDVRVRIATALGVEADEIFTYDLRTAS